MPLSASQTSASQAYLADKSPSLVCRLFPTLAPMCHIYSGSSMFGASLAAKYGLPYAFASHFAPTHLERATRYYREFPALGS